LSLPAGSCRVRSGAGCRQVHVGAAPISKESYNTAKQSADAQYKIDKDACSSLSGNAKDICIAKRKGKDKRRQGGRAIRI
jgi:hypothetical protein